MDILDAMKRGGSSTTRNVYGRMFKAYRNDLVLLFPELFSVLIVFLESPRWELCLICRSVMMLVALPISVVLIAIHCQVFKVSRQIKPPTLKI